MKSYLKKSLVLILFGFILHILFISCLHVVMLWVFDRETVANDSVITVLLHTDTATSDTSGLK